ncbi:hypothetical protein ACGF5O_32740 [Streptomyces sp. NPDC048291]|uniref:hypothetical protein n=1 Tax=Streptomyces sp. NPDC048291 TaxID=3365530 RepID=UPI00370FBED2
MNTAVLRTEFRLFGREPGAVFWVFLFPTLLLVILGSIPSFRGADKSLSGLRPVDAYVPVAVLAPDRGEGGEGGEGVVVQGADGVKLMTVAPALRRISPAGVSRAATRPLSITAIRSQCRCASSIPCSSQGIPGLQAGRECAPRPGGVERRSSLRLRGYGQTGRRGVRPPAGRAYADGGVTASAVGLAPFRVEALAFVLLEGLATRRHLVVEGLRVHA